MQHVICGNSVQRHYPKEVLDIFAGEDLRTYYFICKCGYTQLAAELCSESLKLVGVTLQKSLHGGLLKAFKL